MNQVVFRADGLGVSQVTVHRVTVTQNTHLPKYCVAYTAKGVLKQVL